MAQKNLESNEALESALRNANTDIAEKIVEVLPGELTTDVTDVLTSVQQTLEPIPFAYTGIALGLLALGAWVSNWITKFILFRVLARLFRQTGVIHRGSDTAMGVVARLSNVVPALVITGDTTADEMRRVEQAGLVLLFKPLQPRRLMAALCRIDSHR